MRRSSSYRWISLLRLPGERAREKERSGGEVAEEKGRSHGRGGEAGREGERGGYRHKAIPRHYVRRTMVALALVGVVSVDVPVRRTNRTEGKTL